MAHPAGGSPAACPAASALVRLAEAGIRVSIDKAFVMATDGEPRNAAIVGSVIDLGHNVGFSVTAEGVETAQVLADLTAGSCDTIQGYYRGRPVDEATTRERLLQLTWV